MMAMIDWCCAGFQANHESHQPGDRGTVILFGRDSLNRLEVVLQFRSVEAAMENQLPNIPIPLSLCTDVRIVYCPWCGTNVEAHYERWAHLLLRPGFRVELPKG
jgi:hypothetical protein